MRKRQTAVQASTIAKVVALSIFLGGSGVGYVFQKSQISGLNHEKDANAEAIRELEQRRNRIKFAIEQQTTRDRLLEAARRFNLPLEEPPPQRIIPLPEPTIGPARPVSLAAQK